MAEMIQPPMRADRVVEAWWLSRHVLLDRERRTVELAELCRAAKDDTDIITLLERIAGLLAETGREIAAALGAQRGR